MFGLDYTTPGGLNIPAAKAAGVAFVCRYLTPDHAIYRFKRTTPSEVMALHEGGLALVLVYETWASRSLGGYAAGVWDAKVAHAHLHELGLGAGNGVVYFAVDFDATAANQGPINAYLQGAGSVLGADRVGIYGGYWPCKRALDAGACKYAWQTYAWSGRNLDKRAQLYQYSNGHNLAGVSCDYNHALAADFGQWGSAPPKPKHQWAVIVPTQTDPVWITTSKLQAKFFAHFLSGAKVVPWPK